MSMRCLRSKTQRTNRRAQFTQHGVVSHDGFGGLSHHLHLAAIEPNHAIANGLYLVQRVRAKENGFASIAQRNDAVKGLACKRAIAHRQGFVNDQNIGVDTGGNGKRQAHIHARRVGFNGLVNEGANVGKRNDVFNAVFNFQVC